MPCPVPGGAGYVGSSVRPGARTHVGNPGPEELPALGGQQICVGDIVTLERGYACQVESVAGEEDAVNWGNVGGRAHMALASVDTVGLRDGAESVPAYGHGSVVETYLDGGIAIGAAVGVDLRGVGEDGKRVDRERAVTRPMRRPGDRMLWQRSRLLSEAGSGAVRRLAALGRVTGVVPRDDPRRPVSRQGEVGMVRLGLSGYLG